MSVVPAVDVQKLTSADCKRLVGFYLSELRRIQAKHMEFLNQKFTFIKAVQRDHLTTGKFAQQVGSSYVHQIPPDFLFKNFFNFLLNFVVFNFLNP